MVVLVTVTNNTIKRAAYTPKMFLPTYGAVPLALKDLMPDIHVYSHYMGFTDRNGYEVGFNTPELVGEYIRIFNNALPKDRLQMKPIQFKLELNQKQIYSMGGIYRVKFVTRASSTIVRLRNS